MSELAEQNCVPCRGGMPPMDAGEIAALAARIPEWNVEEANGEKRLVRAFRFANFAAALAFANRVGAAAEAENHHPALLVEWGRVTVCWWTHSVRGLHGNDFIMAARTDRLYAAETGGA